MNLKDKKLFLLDMDGTIYLDNNLFEGVKEFLEYIKHTKGRYIFMTNNSSKSVNAYIEKLENLGINSAPSDFVTSVDATIEFLKERYGDEFGMKNIYIMGTQSFEEQMKDAGFRVFTEPSDDIDIALCGFDRELTYKKLEDVCRLLSNPNKTIDYLATNPDWVCPTEFGYVPDCGSMCRMIEEATGKQPHFIGKPNPNMANIAIKKTGFSIEETMLIGDRLYTDIACGNNAGIDTCFVLSGEGTLDDLKNFSFKPTYVFENIRELLRRIENET